MNISMPNEYRSISLVSLLFFLFLGITSMPIWCEDKFEERAIVRVEAHLNPGSRPQSGTGFLVGTTGQAAYLVTAYHVVAGAFDIQVKFAVSPDLPPARASVTVVDASIDLAVLIVSPVPSEVRYLQVGEIFPSCDKSLTFLGYSLDSRIPARRRANIAQWKGTDFVLQTEVAEMDSGSPVLLDGVVVGWVKATDGKYARCSSVLIKSLLGWQIPLNSDSLSNPDLQQGSCLARVLSTTGGARQAYQGPSRQSQVSGSLPEGTSVRILGRRYADGNLWYWIDYSKGGFRGYVPEEYVRVQESCSND